MHLLTILEYPDPRLKTQAQPLSEAEINASLQTLIDRMLATMYAAPGIGLAATQVDVHKQLIVIDVSEKKDQPLVLINPHYTPIDDTTALLQEGCLSVPEFWADVKRFVRIRVQALDRHGHPQDFECDGLLAHCVQHECDHLKGIVFVDYLSRLKQDRLKKKLAKQG